MNVIALLPYMLLNYEDANELCIRSAENIAQVCTLSCYLKYVVPTQPFFVGEHRKKQKTRKPRYSYEFIQSPYI